MRDAWIETDLEYGRHHVLSGDALFLSLNEKKISACWKADGTEAFIEPIAQSKVEALAINHEVGKTWGHETIGLACERGKGKILHTLYPFNDPMDGQSYTYALQRWLLNFILDAAERPPAKATRRPRRIHFGFGNSSS